MYWRFFEKQQDWLGNLEELDMNDFFKDIPRMDFYVRSDPVFINNIQIDVEIDHNVFHLNIGCECVKKIRLDTRKYG